MGLNVLPGRLLNCFQKTITAPTVEVEKVPAEEIGAALTEQVPAFGDNVRRIPMDGEYYLPTEQGLDTIRSFGQTDLLPYTKAQFDCEDFAMIFRSVASRHFGTNGVGVVIDWSADLAHSYNPIVCRSEDGLDVKLYEPQSDTLMRPEDLPVDDTHVLTRGRIIL